MILFCSQEKGQACDLFCCEKRSSCVLEDMRSGQFDSSSEDDDVGEEEEMPLDISWSVFRLSLIFHLWFYSPPPLYVTYSWFHSYFVSLSDLSNIIVVYFICLLNVVLLIVELFSLSFFLCLTDDSKYRFVFSGFLCQKWVPLNLWAYVPYQV